MEKVQALLQQLVARNDILSKIQLGYLYENDWLVSKNYLKAWAYYLQASEMQIDVTNKQEIKYKIFAMFNLGCLCFYGNHGITANQEEAFSLINKAIEFEGINDISKKLKYHQELIRSLIDPATPDEIAIAVSYYPDYKLFEMNDLHNEIYTSTIRSIIQARSEFSKCLDFVMKQIKPEPKYLFPVTIKLCEPKQEYELLSTCPIDSEFFEIANYRMANLLLNLNACLKIFPDTSNNIIDQKIIQHLMASGSEGKPMLAQRMYEYVNGRGKTDPENIFMQIPVYDFPKNKVAQQIEQTIFILDNLRRNVLKQPFAEEKTLPFRKTKSAYNLLKLTI